MPAGQLYINGNDAYTIWGVSLEDGAIAALMTPPSMKESIVNESRLEHGKRRVNLLVRMDERELTLPMHIVANSATEWYTKYSAFVAYLTSAEILEIVTSFQSGVAYKCIYQSCTQYSQFYDPGDNRSGMAKFALKLIEPNPNDRLPSTT